jgi:hypothetical protein
MWAAQGLKVTTFVARTGFPIRHALSDHHSPLRSADANADRPPLYVQHAGTPLSQDPGLLNALVTYLFGEANVGLISHRDLQAFLQAVLVAHPTVTTFFRLW